MSLHGDRIADENAGMSDQAVEIAISEIRNVPTEKLCSWLLITWTHEDGQPGHVMGLLGPRRTPHQKRLKLAELAVADLKFVLRSGRRTGR